MGAHVSLRIESVGSEVVCLVDVTPAKSPVFAKTTKGDHCFYVRYANSTGLLNGPDTQNYIAGHWS